MNLNEFLQILAGKDIPNIFDKSIKIFLSEMKKNIKFLSQDMQRIDFGEKDLIRV